MLVNSPLGVAWSTIPNVGASSDAQLDAVTDICWAATAEVDNIVNQVLRATLDVEEFYLPDAGGPGHSAFYPNGMVKVGCSRWPILAATGGQLSVAAAFPPNWTTIPANRLRVAGSLLPVAGSSVGGLAYGPQEIMVAPGYIDWSCGRRGWLLQLSYTNGWPHAGITADAAEGAMSLTVDDTAGWAVGGNTIAQIPDGAETETITVTAASATSGPGTLTLAAGLVYAHTASVKAPVLVTTMPASVRWATSLLAAAQALVRGAYAITVQDMAGAEESGKDSGIEGLKTEAEIILHPYSAVVW